MNNLPPGVEPQPLPECALHGGMTVNKRGRYASTEDGFTADQMRAIEAAAAQAGYLAGLEAAHRLAEIVLHAEKNRQDKDWSLMVLDLKEAAALASEIRSLKGKQ